MYKPLTTYSAPKPPKPAIKNTDYNLYGSSSATSFNTFKQKPVGVKEGPRRATEIGAQKASGTGQYNPNASTSPYDTKYGEGYTPTYTPSGPSVTDRSAMLREMYDKLRGDAKAKLQINLRDKLSMLSGLREKASQGASANLNTNDVDRARALQQLYNTLEAGGQRQGAGENITGSIGINTVAQQNAGQINQGLRNYINDVNTQEVTLNRNALDQEAEIENMLGAQQIQSLIEEGRYQDQLSRADQERLDRLQQLQIDNKLREAGLTGYYNPNSYGSYGMSGTNNIDPSLTQYSGNYAAEIDRRKAIDPNDPTLQQLQRLREAKIKSDPELMRMYGGQIGYMPTMAMQQYNSDQDYRNWQIKQAIDEQEWSRNANNPAVKSQILANQLAELQLQYLPQEKKLELQELQKRIAQIGARPPITDYERQMQEIELETARQKLNNLKNPQPEKLDSNAYKTSSDFAGEVDYINKNPNTALKDIQNNANQLIQKYGYEGYSELIGLATPKSKNPYEQYLTK